MRVLLSICLGGLATAGCTEFPAAPTDGSTEPDTRPDGAVGHDGALDPDGAVGLDGATHPDGAAGSDAAVDTDAVVDPDARRPDPDGAVPDARRPDAAATDGARPDVTPPDGAPEADAGPPPELVLPIAGASGRDWIIGRYVDLDPAPMAVRDYTGAVGEDARTVDGSPGLGFLLPNMRAMDAGVEVRAVAAGRVVARWDGEADRNVSCPADPPRDNFVQVRHADGRSATYRHLRRDSVRVELNDAVAAGEPIAEVGSAGCSEWPHLGFELRDGDDAVVDPVRDGLFGRLTPAYEVPLQVIDLVVRRGAIEGRAEAADPGPDDAHAWVDEALGVAVYVATSEPAAAVSVQLVDPDGEVEAHPLAPARLGPDVGLRAVVVDRPGMWRLEALVDQQVVLTRRVEVLADPPGATWRIRPRVRPAAMAELAARQEAGAWSPRGFHADGSGAAQRITAAFERNEDHVAYLHRVPQQVLEQAVAERAADAHLVALDAAAVEGQLLYSATWHAGAVSQRLHLGQDANAMEATRERLSEAGWRAATVSAAVAGNQRQFATLYVRNDAGLRWQLRDLPQRDYAALFAEQSAQGLWPVDLEVYRIGGVNRVFVALLQRAAGPDRVFVPELSRDDLAQRHAELHPDLPLGFVDAYEAAGGVDYSAAWFSE